VRLVRGSRPCPTPGGALPLPRLTTPPFSRTIALSSCGKAGEGRCFVHPAAMRIAKDGSIALSAVAASRSLAARAEHRMNRAKSSVGSAVLP